MRCHLTISCSLFKICQKYTYNQQMICHWMKKCVTDRGSCCLFAVDLPQKVWHILAVEKPGIGKRYTLPTVIFSLGSSPLAFQWTFGGSFSQLTQHLAHHNQYQYLKIRLIYRLVNDPSSWESKVGSAPWSAKCLRAYFGAVKQILHSAVKMLSYFFCLLPGNLFWSLPVVAICH